jgi:hypothetical protein
MMEEEKEQEKKTQKADIKNKIICNLYITPKKKVTNELEVTSEEDESIQYF